MATKLDEAMNEVLYPMSSTPGEGEYVVVAHDYFDDVPDVTLVGHYALEIVPYREAQSSFFAGTWEQCEEAISAIERAQECEERIYREEVFGESAQDF